MIQSTLSEAAKWSDAVFIGQDAEFHGIAIDSRRVEPDSLFEVIPTANSGHIKKRVFLPEERYLHEHEHDR